MHDDIIHILYVDGLIRCPSCNKHTNNDYCATPRCKMPFELNYDCDVEAESYIYNIISFYLEPTFTIKYYCENKSVELINNYYNNFDETILVINNVDFSLNYLDYLRKIVSTYQ